MEIISYTSVGNLRFGETRQVVRERLGNIHKSFKKSRGDNNDTDAYRTLGFHLYYDDNDCLEFVEAFDPANPVFQGIFFIGRQLNVVAKELENMGYPIEMDDVGLNCDSAGIGLTAQFGVSHTEDDLIEGVAVYQRGEYDKL